MRTHALLSPLPLLTLLAAQPAQAELFRGPYDYPSAIAFDGQIGTQLGLGGFTPGGFRLQLGYNHRFASTRDGGMGAWIFGNLGLEFGPGGGVVRGLDPPFALDCGAVGCGHFADIAAGVELTFRTPMPVIPFAKLGLGLGGAYGRSDCQNQGLAITLVDAALGLRYFLTRHIAVGVEAGLSLGPAVYSSSAVCGGGVEFWRATSLLAGVHYAL